MNEKRPYLAPKLTSQKVFLPALSGTTSPSGHYGGFQRPPPSK